jgi:hypothetical protein
MPELVGGTTTETEYAGKVPLANTVTPKGDPKLLSTSDQLRLDYLTGQHEDAEAPRKDGFFYGVDPDYPGNPR